MILRIQMGVYMRQYIISQNKIASLVVGCVRRICDLPLRSALENGVSASLASNGLFHPPPPMIRRLESLSRSLTAKVAVDVPLMPRCSAPQQENRRFTGVVFAGCLAYPAAS